MTERKMGPIFYGEGKPPVGWDDNDYVERVNEVLNRPLIWHEKTLYRLEAAHPHYTQHAALDDAETLERLKTSYPGLVWPELPSRAEEIAREWVDDWIKGDSSAGYIYANRLALFIACKLIAEGVLK